MTEHYDANGETEWACGVQDEPDCSPGYDHRWTSRGDADEAEARAEMRRQDRNRRRRASRRRAKAEATSA